MNTKLKSTLLVVLLFASFTAAADTKTRTSSFEYTPSGLLAKETIEPNSPQDCLQTSYSYDARGNKTASSASPCAGAVAPVTTSAGIRTSTTIYDAIGQFPTASANALGHSETRVFEARFGAVTALTGPNQLATNWQYDSFGRKVRETRADNTYTTWSYQYCGTAPPNATQSALYTACPVLPSAGHIPAYVTTQSDYGSNNTLLSPVKLQYTDALGRVLRVQTQDFAGNTVVSDTEYNALGQVSRQSQPYIPGTSPLWSSFEYDQLGRITKKSSPDSTALGGIASTTYSYNGLVTSSTNPAGQTKTSTKNVQGQVASVQDNAGQITSYSYDALGQLIQTNAAGSVTTLSYNQRGQKTGMVDPAMGVWSYSYNAFSELVSQTDSLNQTSTMAYDALGRMVQRSEPDLVSNWYFDKTAAGTGCGKSVGKLCEATAGNGYKRTHSYDALGRANSTSTVLDNAAAPALVSVTFDPITGRLATKTWPTGYMAAYTYSARGYLTNMTASGTGMTTAKIDILNYDYLGRITQYKHGNNVVTNKTYTADTGRLTKIDAALQGAATGTVQNMSYSYDSLSNLKTRTDTNTGVSENFSYDSLNRLSLYTSLGGSVSPPLSVETKYDARGNLTYKSDVGQYWYDAARPNRLTNITLSAPSGSAVPLSGTRQQAFAFDDYLPTAKVLQTSPSVVDLTQWLRTNKPADLKATSSTTLGGYPANQAIDGDVGTFNHTTVGAGDWLEIDLGASYQLSKIELYNRADDCCGARLNGAVVQLLSATRTMLQITSAVTNGAAGSIHAFATNQTARYLRIVQTGSEALHLGEVKAFGALDPSIAPPESTTAGNGNLLYTVSNDTATGKRTLRWESYTSFNMPSQFKYTNINTTDQSTITSSQTPIDLTQWLRTNKPADLKALSSTTLGGYPASQAVDGNMGTFNHTTVGAGDWLEIDLGSAYRLSNITLYNRADCCGERLNGVFIQVQDAAKNTLQTLPTISNAVSGSQHSFDVDRTARYILVRQSGAAALHLSEVKVSGYLATQAQTAQAVSTQTSDRTLSFTYGPDHQRIKQTTALTGNGTSAYQAGTVWYLNGEDGQSLTYEKEVKNSGVTEHKHYLSAAGITFAMYTKREGIGIGNTTMQQPPIPASVSYSCPQGQTLRESSCIASNTAQDLTAWLRANKPSELRANASSIAGNDAVSYGPQFLINGVISENYPGSQHSAGIAVDWVEVDLGNSYALTSVEIYNRNDYYAYCCGSRLNGAAVQILDASRNIVQTLPAITDAGPASIHSYNINQTARYVRVQHSRIEALHLVEIKIYGIASNPAQASYTCTNGYALTGSMCTYIGPNQLRYFQQDHLGSTAVITDEAGGVVERLAYDPWGKRRFANGLADTNDSIVPITTDRGYTEHEHLDEVGVIHMNGRVYDPLVGRFMSADPFIQAPYELQSHNRYAYVMNNPLAYTDPSGYFLGGFISGISDTISSAWQGASDSITSISHQPYVSTAVAIAVAYYTGSVNGLGWSATAAGAAGAAAGAMTAGGNVAQIVKAAAIGGLTAWGFEWAGTTGGEGRVGATSYTRYAAHGLVGCVSSVASGGQCRQGAAAAVFGKWVTNYTPQDWSVMARGVAATVAGGVGSVIGGGKFQNGAVTAAYGYLFNELMSRGGVSAQERRRQSGYADVADEGKGGVTWKPNYPATVPVDGLASDALQCTARCTGSDIYATGGQETSGHSKGSHHYLNEAVDFRALTVSNSKVFSCAANCGFKAGWWENWGNPHWHFQQKPGNGVPAIR